MERDVGGGASALMGRAEIDTNPPFRSVKEAVMLFGEKVLAAEIANKLIEMKAAANRSERSSSRLSSLEAELEETRQNLEKAQEERVELEIYLCSLKQELERTKIELKQLQPTGREKPAMDSDVEDIKFVENSIEVETERPGSEEHTAFLRKKSVKFANPPSLARYMSTEERVFNRQVSMDRESSQKNSNQQQQKKKRSMFPIIASMFSKKKNFQGEASLQAHGPRRVA
ncbi:WEB family protein [Apostasia shenzhenica]|uniref:WEB family protein n=1 Tax=Apostasia shenzhenica TaxID=1088818 RepID=A0A2I0AR80_9ASPA|nr:WEB family protein [Apostasia shenzhenica]